MKINLLTSFAAGLLIATTVSGSVYFTDKAHASKMAVKTVLKQPSETEMKDKLQAAGYVVQTKADYDKAVNDAKASAQKAAPAETAAPGKVVSQVVVNVTMGMTSIDVGHTLQAAKLIPNAFKFSQDIEKRGLEKALRPGVYTVNSSMTYDQMIATIFKK